MKYICTYCSIYTYDDQRGDAELGIAPGTRPDDFPEGWVCPNCGQPHGYMQQISEEEHAAKTSNRPVQPWAGQPQTRDLSYYRTVARQMLTGLCGEFSVCDGSPGRTCQGQKFGAPIGFGGAGQGTTFHANCTALQRYRLKVRLVKEHKEPDTSTTIWGVKIRAPVMGASMAGVKNSMNGVIPEEDFYRGLVEGARSFGTIGLVGNTAEVADDLGVRVVEASGGQGIPVFKPQPQPRLLRLFQIAEKANVLAIGVDLDGAGSVTWSRKGKLVERKTEGQFRELVDSTSKPVFFKGVMCLDDAASVVDSGASAIYVSNHGGRVLDAGQGVAEVLPEIALQFGGKTTIMADGCVRTGYDVLKVLALGADLALIGRPLARMSLAGGAEAVRLYYEYVLGDLRMAMIMTGCDSVKEIDDRILAKQD
jgi:4-hydroxymandelate oxidase